MKFGKTLASTGVLAAAMMLSALPVAAVAAPQLTIQTEEAAHPRIVAAIHEMKHALEELEAAPEDFGGNKGVAVHDTRVAIHSLRKALYFRLHMDDAAIDRVN
jgi:hypothetical protein